MTRPDKTVFISYRRTNISWALAIFQHLKRYRYDVFIDFKGMANGSFEQIILENIKARTHFLVLLTPSALNRCNQAGDWLRREIETAIDSHRNIVPLFLKGFDFATPRITNQLTGKLAMLKSYNGLTVPSLYFDEALARLRSKFLRVPLNVELKPPSEVAASASADDQKAASSAPKVTHDELTAQEWFERGCSLFDDSDEELRCWNETIRLDPNFGTAFHNRASLLKNRGQFDKAIQDYSEAIRLTPSDPSPLVHRGIVRRQMGDSRGSQEDFAKAYSLAPDTTHKFLIEHGYWSIPIPAEIEDALNGDDAGIRSNAQKALQSYQTYYNVCLDNDMDIGAKLDWELRLLDEAAAYLPSFVRAHHLRADVLRAKGEYRKALTEYGKAIRINSGNWRALRDRAVLQAVTLKTNITQALKDFDRAIKLKPDNYELFYYRGMVLREHGAFKRARKDLDEAIRLRPDHHHSYYERGLVLKRLGRHAEAIADLEFFLASTDGDPYPFHREYEKARLALRDLKNK